MLNRNWLKELVKILITDIVLPQKVRPEIIRSFNGLDEHKLEESIKQTGTRICQSIDSMKVFDVQLFIARVPNLEFLEVMVLTYYLTLNLEKLSAKKPRRDDVSTGKDFKILLDHLEISAEDALEKLKNYTTSHTENEKLDDPDELYKNIEELFEKKQDESHR